MHICYLCNEYPPAPHGGVGTFTRALARGLLDCGHRVSVVGLYPVSRPEEEDDDGVRIVRVPANGTRGVSFVLDGFRIRRAVRRLHAASPIDLIEGPELSLSAVWGEPRVPRLIRMHGGHHFFSVTLGKRPRLLRGRVEAMSFRNADAVCAVSRFVAETTRELLRLGDRPIEILPNSVDVGRFAPRPEVAEEEGLVLFTGTVCEKKGVRQLVQAWPRVAEAVPHARLCVAGRDTTDPETGASFTARLQTLLPPGLADRVEFLGHVENSRVPELALRAQVCVYPSHMEALPIAWLEGLAMGRAVVVSRTGPGPEVVEDGVSGLLCDPHDPASIAEGIVTLLRDPELRARLGAGARRRAVSHFSSEVLVARNEEFYRRCLGERGRV
jgi:glycosyltransferase involved in cell wall biosynthesis